MSVELVSKTVAFEGLIVPVWAWRWVCDGCGFAEAFPDRPMVDGFHEWSARERGWRLRYGVEDAERCLCPTCVALDRSPSAIEQRGE